VRSEGEIRDAMDDTYDRVWHARHVQLGAPAEGAVKAAEIRTRLGDRVGEDVPAERYLSGRLEALRWVLGEPWGNSGS